MSMHIGETEVTPLEAIGQLLVVDPQQMQHRGVEIVHVDRVLRDVVAEVIGLPMDVAFLDSGTGHPQGEAAGVMIATVDFACQLALTIGCPSELTTPDNQGIVEQAPLFEIFDQRSRWLVGVATLTGKLVVQVSMLVPTHVEQLDEPDVALGETTGEQAVVGISASLVNVLTIHIEDMLWLIGKVSQLRNRGLHSIRHFVLLNPGIDLRVAKLLEFLLVQFRQVVQHAASSRGIEAGRVVQVEHRIADAHEFHAGVLRREKAAAPQSVIERLTIRTTGSARNEGHKTREIVVGAAESVGKPRADARAPRELMAGLEKGDRRVVIDRLGVHRADQGDVVRDAGDIRQQLAEFHLRVAVSGELVTRSRERESLLILRHPSDSLSHREMIAHVFPEVFLQLRLVIEEVLLRRRTALEHVDDPLRFRRVVIFLHQPVGLGNLVRKRIALEQGRQCCRSYARRGFAEKVSAGFEKLMIEKWIHSSVIDSSRFNIR